MLCFHRESYFFHTNQKSYYFFTFEIWHCPHIWKTLTWPQYFAKKEGLGPLTILTPPFFIIEVSVSSQKGGCSYICMLRVSILNWFLWFVYYMLVLFRQCGIFYFSLYCTPVYRYKFVIFGFCYLMASKK
jgi:hypothetical protein